MSGTASRFQTRFGYAPDLRAGIYPAAQPTRPIAPLPAGVTPPVSFLMPMSFPSAVAAPAAPPVLAGSINPERVQNMADGAGGSAQGEYGGPGPTGAPSTGDFGADLGGFASAAGPAAAGIASGPMGVTGFGLGAIASGLADLAGAPGLSGAFAQSVGLTGPPAYSSMESPALGAPKGDEPAGLVGFNDPAMEGSKDFGAGGDVAGSSAENASPGGADKGDTSSDFQRGGYTGSGHPAEPAGIVHRNEVVIPAAQVARYGLDPLLMLARGQVAPSRLAALLAGAGSR